MREDRTLGALIKDLEDVEHLLMGNGFYAKEIETVQDAIKLAAGLKTLAQPGVFQELLGAAIGWFKC